SKGNEHLVVVVDYCSKWIELFPIRTAKAPQIANILVREIFTRVGVLVNSVLKHLVDDIPAFSVFSKIPKQLIKEILFSKPVGTVVPKEYEDTGTICDSSRRQMVNILAAHMTETEGRIPQRLTKEKYALGIITLFPALKDPLSPKGYASFLCEHFYDGQSGSGFPEWRLKTIQRKTKLAVKSDASKVETTGGPTVGRNVIHLDNQLSDESCKEAIALTNHTSDRETILLKMHETFEYRQRLVRNPKTSSTGC
ncbi:hypothetical protein NFI96_026376, partial [Prochilodus magdalenae]